jgi:hypothetical protein
VSRGTGPASTNNVQKCKKKRCPKKRSQLVQSDEKLVNGILKHSKF